MIGFRALKRAGGTAALLLAMAGTTSAAPLTVNVAVDGTWLLLDDRMSEGQYYTGAGAVYPGFPALGAGTSDIGEATRYSWNSASYVRLDLTDWSTVGDGFRVWVNAFNPATPLGTFTGTQWQDIPGCNTAQKNDGSGVGCHYYFGDGSDNTDNQGGVEASDIDQWFADLYTAHGSLVFGPGAYELVIQGYLIPNYSDANKTEFIDATVALRLSEVPEPASLLLLGSGLLGGAMRLRKKRQPGVKA